MKQKNEQEELIVRYFFGELPEAEKKYVEERFLVDNQFFEQMLCVEDALIDSYAQGQLSDQERNKIAENFIPSAQLNQEVEFTNNLISDLARVTPVLTDDKPREAIKPSSRWRSLLAILGLHDISKRPSFALMLGAALLGLSIIIWNLILQNKLSQVESRQELSEQREREIVEQLNIERERNQELIAIIEDERQQRNNPNQGEVTGKTSDTPPPLGDLVSILLDASAISRGGGNLKEFEIPKNAKQVQIKINIGAPQKDTIDSATIRTFDGQEIWSRSDIKTDRKSPRITFTLSADLFNNEDYTLTLNGKKDDGETIERNYSFRIKR